MPDATLVEVEGPDEHVKISVAGGRLSIDVRSADGTVNVELPLGSVASTLRRLASACA